MAWVTAFVSISHCSLAEVASQRLAGQAHGQRFNQVALALATSAIGVSILAYAALIGLFLLRPTMFGTLSPWLLLCAFIGLPWMIWEIYGTALLIICERIMLANIGLVLGRTVSILLVLLAVGALGWGVSGALLASVLGQMLVAAMPAWMVWRNWHASHGPVALKQELAGLFSGGVRLHLNAIGSMLMGSTSVIILNAKLGTAATGQFQMAQQLVTILLVLAQATTQMLYGRLGAVGVQGAWRLQRRLVPALSLLTLLAGGVAGALAPWWLPWVAGAGFADAVPLFQWLVPGLAVSAFSTLMAPQWIGRGLFLTASLCSLSPEVTAAFACCTTRSAAGCSETGAPFGRSGFRMNAATSRRMTPEFIHGSPGLRRVCSLWVPTRGAPEGVQPPAMLSAAHRAITRRCIRSVHSEEPPAPSTSMPTARLFGEKVLESAPGSRSRSRGAVPAWMRSKHALWV
jgi:hypothetical protein